MGGPSPPHSSQWPSSLPTPVNPSTSGRQPYEPASQPCVISVLRISGRRGGPSLWSGTTSSACALDPALSQELRPALRDPSLPPRSFGR